MHLTNFGSTFDQGTPYGGVTRDRNRTRVPKLRYQLVNRVEGHARAMKQQALQGHMWSRS